MCNVINIHTYIRTYVHTYIHEKYCTRLHCCHVGTVHQNQNTVVSRSLVLAIMLYIRGFGLECKFSKGYWRINGWLLIYFQVQYQ